MGRRQKNIDELNAVINSGAFYDIFSSNLKPVTYAPNIHRFAWIFRYKGTPVILSVYYPERRWVFICEASLLDIWKAKYAVWKSVMEARREELTDEC